MSRRVAVHHFVANLTTRQYGPHPTSDLLGVDYWHDVPPDTEFPRTITRMDVFTRFYLRRANPVEFSVRIRWLDTPERKPRTIGHYGPYLVSFLPTHQVHDHVFHVSHIRVQGVGRHDVYLVRKRDAGWQGRRFVKVAETHFSVER